MRHEPMAALRRLYSGSRAWQASLLLRLALAAIFLSHGITRAVMGRVPPFGEFLDATGFPFGLALAWGITLFEILAGIALLANRLVRPVAALLSLEMLGGIALVHISSGWFVVGHGTNGAEYSVLIVAALMAVWLLDGVL